MAFFWFGSAVLYGVAANQTGALGTILGWPIFMSLIVLVATAWGVATGEWKHAGARPLRILSPAELRSWSLRSSCCHSRISYCNGLSTTEEAIRSVRTLFAI